jgi:hypothetical protein
MELGMPWKRRPRGEGTIFRRSDGMWVAGIVVRDHTGKSRQVRRYARTRQDAERLLAMLKAER